MNTRVSPVDRTINTMTAPSLAVLGFAFLIAYSPMLLGLIRGPWSTEQEGHGPLIIAASLWCVWHARARLKSVEPKAAYVCGWVALLSGLILMFLGRTQGVLSAEFLAAILTIVGCVLMLAGFPMLRALAFPVCFLLFAVPAPDWAIDAATLPLKVAISNGVTRLLYMGGFPIAQDGVMITIGPYELLVRDACSGMNSILALSAIGVFYVYVLRRDQRVRAVLLLLATVPIAVAANFLRVLALVLIAYYWGIDVMEGVLHGLTGLVLFLVALGLFVVFDWVLGLVSRRPNRSRAQSTSPSRAIAPSAPK